MREGEQRKPTMKENIVSELIEETSESEQGIVRDETEVRVELKESEVLIEVGSRYNTDYIVADIMEAVSKLKHVCFLDWVSLSQWIPRIETQLAKFRGTAVTYLSWDDQTRAQESRMLKLNQKHRFW